MPQLAVSPSRFRLPRHLTRKPVPLVLLLGALAALVLVTAAGLSLSTLRERDFNEARNHLGMLNQFLVEETDRTMSTVDLALTNVRHEILSRDSVDEASFLANGSDKTTRAVLVAALKGTPFLQSIDLIAADGQVINSSGGSLGVFPREASSGDQNNAQAFRSGCDEDFAEPFFIDKPVENPTTGTMTIPFCRHIDSLSGTRLGTLRGMIDIAYFKAFYQIVQKDPNIAVGLWRRDGTMLLQYPPAFIFSLLLRDKVSADAEIPSDDVPRAMTIKNSEAGPARLVIVGATRQFPLVVTISFTSSQIYLAWWRTAVMAAIGCLLCFLLIGFAIWLLTRQLTAYEALDLAIAEKSEAIAARNEAEAQLRQAQKLEAIGQLTGGIAHDFNNLLTAVLGNLELLSRHVEGGDAKLQRWTRNALEAAKRGASLTARLLAFSRRQPLEPQPADLFAMLQSMSDLLSRTLGENIQIEMRITEHLWRPFVDINQLDNAILNICLNARDAMEGRGKLVIAARNVTREETNNDMTDDALSADIIKGDYVLIEISDKGPGIDKAVLERVFEPFFTTKPIGQGTGLGLSQVYGFLKQSGGHIEIESEKGQGTTVRLFLPRARADAEQANASEPLSLAEPVGHRETLLIVEDDAEVRGYSVEILRSLGYTVLVAKQANEALAYLHQSRAIDLLFTDIGLPGMNGRDLAEAARMLRPGLPVLFTSGYARSGVLDEEHLDLGMQLLRKPFSRTELAWRLRFLLATRQAEGSRKGAEAR
ncbi:ATP-binding protein [Beijerinckia indica]|uniref:histidine kinase n=1 Tax=Beijerinckia indica subsp. indica (strain ATCC 9039 / DSM 1715 / NCIMB 8712) TaxID=395963 RepID=B2IBF1_BEII9|nr:ATP-binding protein [Beijerinckia indica]ACB96577.1 integral membrane sensor hybrid histidine kinase [Beijerinckia indica subsp. indica ATCC 9039]